MKSEMTIETEWKIIELRKKHTMNKIAKILSVRLGTVYAVLKNHKIEPRAAHFRRAHKINTHSNVEMLREHVSDGYSYGSFAGKIRLPYEVLTCWSEINPDVMQIRQDYLAWTREKKRCRVSR